MENISLAERIEQIVEIFGMRHNVIAKAMNIGTQTYRSKKDPNNPRHKFNEKNLQDLIRYIKQEAEKL